MAPTHSLGVHQSASAAALPWKCSCIWPPSALWAALGFGDSSLQFWALGTHLSSYSLHCFHPGWARGWSISKKELIPAPALLISSSVEPWSCYLIALFRGHIYKMEASPRNMLLRVKKYEQLESIPKQWPKGFHRRNSFHPDHTLQGLCVATSFYRSEALGNLGEFQYPWSGNK